MTIQTEKYARKPFFVDAVQVTEENMADVAEWCQGDLRSLDDRSPAANYVKVRVHRPLTERQTQAHIGDWVLYAGTGFKVYTPKAFEKSFESVTAVQGDESETVYRSAESGQYVTEEVAHANPATTVSEEQ